MGGNAAAGAELTGMAKHFNSVTIRGRANVAKVRRDDKMKKKNIITKIRITK